MAAKISILMSVYNPNWDYLKETLDSIAAQTYKDYELVIVNDGADDAQLSHLLAKYNFEKTVVENPVNLGLPRSLNAGLEKCSGEYVARIDDDDLMMPQRLELQVEFMDNNPNVVSAFSNYLIINDKGKKIGERIGDHNKNVYKTLLYKGNCLCHSTLFARKSELMKLGGYDGQMIYAQDYDLYLRMIKDGDIYELEDLLVSFRESPGRISKNKRFLSALFSYYASIKNLEKFNFLVFGMRTILTVKQLLKILRATE